MLRKRKRISAFLILAGWFCSTALSYDDETRPGFLERWGEAPFCYLCEGRRSWPLLPRPLGPGEQIRIRIKKPGATAVRSSASAVEFRGVRVSVSPQGKLEISSSGQSPSFDVELSLHSAGKEMWSRDISIAPAPKPRPISYYADFADDVINIFGLGIMGKSGFLHSQLDSPSGDDRRPRSPRRDSNGRLRVDKAGYDQYFRRLQCQGIARIIVRFPPFPLINDPAVYEKQDWDRFEKQALAILNSRELDAMLERKEGFVTWAWLRDLIGFRLDREAQAGLATSAAEHGISLAICFRPLEPAITKFYVVPVFDADGAFLWNYLPQASPAVNYHAAEVGFANYREVLAGMGHIDQADAETIQVLSPANVEVFLRRFRETGDNLRIRASDYPPLQSDSLVLQRRPDGSFTLRPYQGLHAAAERRMLEIKGFRVSHDPAKGLLITGLRIPRHFQYILLDNPAGKDGLEMLSREPVLLWSRKGTPLGRLHMYWSLDDTTAEGKKTRAAAITPDGECYPAFFASEASGSLLSSVNQVELGRGVLVIDRGEPFSTEIVDFNLEASRTYAIRELQAIHRYPAFTETYINTRSHTQLPGSAADGEEGIRSKVDYRREGKRHSHLGLDLTYAPRDAISDPVLRALARDPGRVPDISSWRHGEWIGTCQSEDCDSRWRYTRNRGVASGVRLLLQDLAAAFPDKRLRVVIPERATVDEGMSRFLKDQPAKTVSYTPSRNNWIQRIGEGMALLDLSGLPVEPVLLGTGPFVAAGVLDRYLDLALEDMKDNHGSAYQGRKAIMYEGQWTLKKQVTRHQPQGWVPDGRAIREDRICRMLARDEIAEVILYEAADWAYSLPLVDPFRFLDDCPAKPAAPDQERRYE